MQYIAKHFVRVNGNMYVPGEVLETDAFVSEKSLARLVRIGAVEPFGKTEEPAEDPAADVGAKNGAANAEGTESAQAEEFAEEDGGAAEIVIDAMDGVVAASSGKKSGRRKRQ